MIDPLSAIGLVAIGAVLAYAVPFGILMWKTRGSELKLSGLRFVDRSPLRDIDWADGPHAHGPLPPIRVMPASEPVRAKDYYDMSRERGGDE